MSDYDTTYEENGCVYILTNPSMPGLVKIGMTTRDVHARLLELSSATGVPSRFECKYQRQTSYPRKMERMVHDSLSKHRVTGSEFFELAVVDARDALDLIKITGDRFPQPKLRAELLKELEAQKEIARLKLAKQREKEQSNLNAIRKAENIRVARVREAENIRAGFRENRTRYQTIELLKEHGSTERIRAAAMHHALKGLGSGFPPTCERQEPPLHSASMQSVTRYLDWHAGSYTPAYDELVSAAGGLTELDSELGRLEEIHREEYSKSGHGLIAFAIFIVVVLLFGID